MLLRPAQKIDLPGIVEIYNQAVADRFCTGDTEPVSVQDRRDWFDQHSADTYPIYVAEEEGELLGWCSLSPYRTGRAALRTTAEISYYISANRRGEGIGNMLMQHALAQASLLGFTHLLAILMDVNNASIRLLQKHHFKRWGHLPDVARFGPKVCGQFIYGRKL